jgi:hypothetical protein
MNDHARDYAVRRCRDCPLWPLSDRITQPSGILVSIAAKLRKKPGSFFTRQQGYLIEEEGDDPPPVTSETGGDSKDRVTLLTGRPRPVALFGERQRSRTT